MGIARDKNVLLYGDVYLGFAMICGVASGLMIYDYKPICPIWIVCVVGCLAGIFNFWRSIHNDFDKLAVVALIIQVSLATAIYGFSALHFTLWVGFIMGTWILCWLAPIFGCLLHRRLDT
jgi:hypothetical protein